MKHSRKIYRYMRRILVKRQTILMGILYIVIVLFLQIIQYTTLINNILGFFLLAFSAAWIYKCWNNNIALLVSLFIGYCNYSIVAGVYWNPTIRDNEYLYNQISNIRTYGIGVSLLLLTMIWLSIGTTKYEKTNITSNLIKEENYSNILFWGSLAAFLVCIAEGYSATVGGRGGSSPLYEYGVICMLLMFYYSGKRRWALSICFVMVIVYSLNSILNGTRVEALTCIFIFLFCFFKSKLKPSAILAGMLVGILLFSVVGAIRGNWKLLEQYGYGALIDNVFKNKLVFDTCTHAYFPMLCMIEEFTPFSLSNASYYFIRFLATIFLGQSRVIDGDLISVVRKKYYHNFGGVTVGFYYVWFGYLGAAFYATFINKIFGWATDKINNDNDFMCFVATYVIASAPRWYLYGPWAFTRGALMAVIVFFLFNICHKFILALKHR